MSRAPIEMLVEEAGDTYTVGVGRESVFDGGDADYDSRVVFRVHEPDRWADEPWTRSPDRRTTRLELADGSIAHVGGSGHPRAVTLHDVDCESFGVDAVAITQRGGDWPYRVVVGRDEPAASNAPSRDDDARRLGERDDGASRPPRVAEQPPVVAAVWGGGASVDWRDSAHRECSPDGPVSVEIRPDRLRIELDDDRHVEVREDGVEAVGCSRVLSPGDSTRFGTPSAEGDGRSPPPADGEDGNGTGGRSR